MKTADTFRLAKQWATALYGDLVTEETVRLFNRHVCEVANECYLQYTSERMEMDRKRVLSEIDNIEEEYIEAFSLVGNSDSPAKALLVNALGRLRSRVNAKLYKDLPVSDDNEGDR